eukprot:5474646-Alexandrium_andersonii.AAC.1
MRNCHAPVLQGNEGQGHQLLRARLPRRRRPELDEQMQRGASCARLPRGQRTGKAALCAERVGEELRRGWGAQTLSLIHI